MGKAGCHEQLGIQALGYVFVIVAHMRSFMQLESNHQTLHGHFLRYTFELVSGRGLSYKMSDSDGDEMAPANVEGSVETWRGEAHEPSRDPFPPQLCATGRCPLVLFPSQDDSSSHLFSKLALPLVETNTHYEKKASLLSTCCCMQFNAIIHVVKIPALWTDVTSLSSAHKPAFRFYVIQVCVVFADTSQ